jgi:hypothetical protein
MRTLLVKNLNRLLTFNFLIRKVEPLKRRVVVVRDDGIGDFLLFTGAFRNYVNFFQEDGYEIFLIVRDEISIRSMEEIILTPSWPVAPETPTDPVGP